jgi:double zinc ribbon protein
MVEEPADEIQLTALEGIFVVGIIGCMLLATWEVAHLLADNWLGDWVRADAFTRKRIIYYGIAFAMALPCVAVTSAFAFQFGRFGRTINRAFLWYGTLLLISTIAVFVFDCLPEVLAGFIGAAVFIAAIYIVQKRYFTQDRVIRGRLEKGKCFACSHVLRPEAHFCSACGTPVGKECPSCSAVTKVTDAFCWRCRGSLPGSS